MTNRYQWNFLEQDGLILEDLQAFLPEKIWDSHAHIYRISDLNLLGESLWTGGPEEVSIQVWKTEVSKLFPHAMVEGGLFFPAPLPQVSFDDANRFLVDQLDIQHHSRGLALIKPEKKPEDMKEILSHPQIVGLKPYHVYSQEKPTFQSSISGFLPEIWWQWAHDNHAVVMLHIVKDEAISDPENLEEIRRLCGKYPAVKLVLAHAARSFHAPHAKGVARLRGLENIWFDMSGICEPESILQILRNFGPTRLLWGSDFPVSNIRGRSVTLGDGFFWLDTAQFPLEDSLGRPVLVGLESIRALRTAAEQFGLNKTDVADIFYHNGLQLLGKKKEEENQELYLRAKKIMPGGVQLLSKRPENQAPGQWPPYYKEARGCEIWDLDGKHYYDMSTNAVGSCLLGYSHPDINQAVIRRIHLGNMCSLNSPEEVALADRLCSIHPWAEQARFAKGGGEACAIAVRIARATTGRSKVAICGYHGWQDWYLAANLGETDELMGHLLPGLAPVGVPKELRETTLTFRYNDLQGFEQLIDTYGDQLAAVFMEPCRNVPPLPGFLEAIRLATQKHGILLIFDEITIGWRMHFGGAHLLYGIVPDMAVFAKALGNGYPIAAIIGTRAAMDGAHHSFISSTYWTESIGPTAALATLQKMTEIDVPSHVATMGQRVQECWQENAKRVELPIEVYGLPCLAGFSFLHADAAVLKTLYTQLMLEQGFLATTAFYPTLAHEKDIVSMYCESILIVFNQLSQWLQQGDIRSMLKGEVAQSGFSRLI